MSFKRRFLRNSIRDEIKERQRAWRRDKYDPALHQAREMIKQKTKKER